MPDYIHHQGGVIDRAPGPLPKSWRNISGLDLMDAAGLKALGWLPVRYVAADFNSATQIRTGPSYAVAADEVVATYAVRAKTAAELDNERDTEAAALLGNRALGAYIMAVNDGSITPGANMTAAQLRAAIKAKL